MFDSVVFETLLEKYVINGGVMMFVLVPCSLLMLGAILQGMIRLRRGRVLPADLLRKARHVNSPEQRVRFIRDLQLHPQPSGPRATHDAQPLLQANRPARSAGDWTGHGPSHRAGE